MRRWLSIAERKRSAQRAATRARERDNNNASDQLELALQPAAQRSGKTPCEECGRWNYHLASCSRRPMRTT